MIDKSKKQLFANIGHQIDANIAGTIYIDLSGGGRRKRTTIISYQDTSSFKSSGGKIQKKEKIVEFNNKLRKGVL